MKQSLSGMDGAGVDALVYPFADYPAAQGVVEVADGIFWMSSPLPFAGLRQVNLWLLRDGDGWTMVDCGYGNEPARQSLTAIWASVLDGRPVTRLIVTHFHPDHVGNAAFIAERWGLRVLMTQAEWMAANLAVHDEYTDNVARRIGFFRAHGLPQERIDVFVRDVVLYSAGVRLPPDFLRIRDGDVIPINGDRWTVVVGEGHSPEHAALYCARAPDPHLRRPDPADDHHQYQRPVRPSPRPIRSGSFSIRAGSSASSSIPRCLVLPSHRRPFRNVRHRLDELAHHHDERLSLVLGRAPATRHRGRSHRCVVPARARRAPDGLRHGRGDRASQSSRRAADAWSAGATRAGIYRFKTIGGGDILYP